MIAVRSVRYFSILAFFFQIVLDEFTVVFKHRVRSLSSRPELYDTVCFINVFRRVVFFPHRNDRAVLYEYRKFPKRSVKVIENSSTLILLTCEVVDPNVFLSRQVNVISDITTIILCICRILIDWSYKHL